MSGEVHRQRCVLYGPNEEIISEVNPLPVQLEGESKVIITGEPTVKINAAEGNKEVAIQNVPTINLSGAAALKEVSVQNEPTLKIAALEASKTVAIQNEPTLKIAALEASKTVAIQNKITIANIEAGKLEVTNKIVVGTLEGEPKIKPEGQTAEAVVIVGKPIPVAGIDGEKKVRTLLTSATGILKVEGIAGTTAEIEGKTAVGTEPTDKPLDIGVEGTDKRLLRTKGDDRGTQYIIPFNPVRPFNGVFSQTAPEGEANHELALVEEWRYIITAISLSVSNAALLTSFATGAVKIIDNVTEVGEWTCSAPQLQLASTGTRDIAGNPLIICAAVGTKLVVNLSKATNVSAKVNVHGYMMMG